MIHKYWIYLTLLCILLLAACTINPTPEIEVPIATPEPETTTVTGRVLSSTTNDPLSGVIVRLAEVVRDDDEGAFILDVAFSPGAITDEQGVFVISNIPAQEYVIVVGDVYDQYEIILEPSGIAKTWVTQEGVIENLGDLSVKLDPVP
jgi:hypothetical protein